MKNVRACGTLILLALLGPAAPATACPAGQYSSLGMCLPKIGGDGAKAVEHVKDEVKGQVAGNPLAIWLQQSRDSARPAAMPIPPQIRSALTGFVRDDILNKARYKVGDRGLLNSAANIMGLNRNVAAVTLVDVIVFRDWNDASNNLPLWAHELRHVRQFSEWGVRNFGIRYMRSSSDVEGDAYAEERRYLSWAGSRSQPPAPWSANVVPPPPPIVAAVCNTPMGTCQLYNTVPRGAPCSCQGYMGLVYGQAY